MTTITQVEVQDIRFPSSRSLVPLIEAHSLAAITENMGGFSLEEA